MNAILVETVHLGAPALAWAACALLVARRSARRAGPAAPAVPEVRATAGDSGPGSLAALATLAAAALLLHAGWLALRALRSGRAPFSGVYESLVFLGLVLQAKALASARGMRGRARAAWPAFLPGLVAALVALLLPASAKAIGPAPPALDSPWILVHVPAVLYGYASLALALVASIREARAPARTRAADDGHDAAARETRSAVAWIGAGIVFGGFWADAAWGVFWSWDPKETAALATWAVAVAALHARGPRLRALLLALSVAAMAFTYFGTAWLLPGLHAYR